MTASPTHSQPTAEPVRQSCAFCGTTPNGDDKSCASYEEAIQKTTFRPFGCPWFTNEDRKDWERLRDPNRPDNQIASLKARIEELEGALRGLRDHFASSAMPGCDCNSCAAITAADAALEAKP